MATVTKPKIDPAIVERIVESKLDACAGGASLREMACKVANITTGESAFKAARGGTFVNADDNAAYDNQKKAWEKTRRELVAECEAACKRYIEATYGQTRRNKIDDSLYCSKSEDEFSPSLKARISGGDLHFYR